MELGDEGNSGQDKLGIQKSTKNTGPIEMEGVSGNGEGGFLSQGNIPSN